MTTSTEKLLQNPMMPTPTDIAGVKLTYEFERHGLVSGVIFCQILN